MTNAAALAITRNAEGGYQVAYEVPQEYDMFGKECTVDLIDVDFDGRREIYLRFSGVRTSDAWLFKWDGLEMTNITPTRVISGTRGSEICANRSDRSDPYRAIENSLLKHIRLISR